MTVYGVFYADDNTIAAVYTADAIDYNAYKTNRAVIHADIPAWVTPTNCKLIQIAGIYHAVTKVEYAIAEAVSFGSRQMIKFAAENVMLGITQAGMTTTIRNVIKDVVNCLQTGSLYDAITAVRAIPAENKDATFVTDARLLTFINQIEIYLKLPVSQTL